MTFPAFLTPPRNSKIGYAITSVAYLNGTDAKLSYPVTTPDDSTEFFVSMWVLDFLQDSAVALLNEPTNVDYWAVLSSTWQMEYRAANTGSALVRGSAKLQDPHWRHVALSMKTSEATASERLKMYDNGEEITSLANTAYPVLNYVGGMMAAGKTIEIGNYAGGFTEMIIGDVQLLDGMSVQGGTVSISDYCDISSGIPEPVRPSASNYGTEGSYLGPDIATGVDSSGNGNDWTVNGTITAVDGNTPTDVGCTLNPLDAYNSAGTLGSTSNGNLTVSGWGDTGIAGSIAAADGSYWWTVKIDAGSDTDFGIVSSLVGNYYDGVVADGFSFDAVGYRGNNGYKMLNGSAAAYGSTYTLGDTIGVHLNITGGYVEFYKQTASVGAFVAQGQISISSSTKWKPLYHSRQTAAGVTFDFTDMTNAPSGALPLTFANLTPNAVTSGTVTSGQFVYCGGEPTNISGVSYSYRSATGFMPSSSGAATWDVDNPIGGTVMPRGVLN